MPSTLSSQPHEVFRDLEKIQEVHDVERWIDKSNLWLLFLGISVTVASLFGVGLAIGRGSRPQMIATSVAAALNPQTELKGSKATAKPEEMDPTTLRNSLSFPTVLQDPSSTAPKAQLPGQLHGPLPGQDTAAQFQAEQNTLPTALQQMLAQQGDYAVQVMSTSSKEEAISFVERLKGMGHPASLAVFPRKNGVRGTLWRVRIGFFTGRQQAEVYRAYVEEQTQRDAMVTKVAS